VAETRGGLRAVLFDFDGVLVDSEPLHFGSLRDALLPEGIALDEDEYKRSYLAYDDRGAIRLALERHGRPCSLEHVEAIARRKAQDFQRLLPQVPFFAGARELVRSLAEVMPVAIASGALRGEIEAILKTGGLYEPFSTVVGADDVHRGKPDPEPYLTAMRRLHYRAPGLEPSQCLVFEDSVPGILSARAAGMTVVGVTNSYPAAKLNLAHRVVDSLEGLGPDMLRSFVA
jgi:beta-phosphoglucomutase-like phosphatase (HAD superfamily)